jgi:hypothetical protein
MDFAAQRTQYNCIFLISTCLRDMVFFLLPHQTNSGKLYFYSALWSRFVHRQLKIKYMHIPFIVKNGIITIKIIAGSTLM